MVVSVGSDSLPLWNSSLEDSSHSGHEIDLETSPHQMQIFIYHDTPESHMLAAPILVRSNHFRGAWIGAPASAAIINIPIPIPRVDGRL